jgi:hypothetical protein
MLGTVTIDGVKNMEDELRKEWKETQIDIVVTAIPLQT